MKERASQNSKSANKPSASFNKKQRSRLAEIAAQKKINAEELRQDQPIPSEEETKKALMNILEGVGEGRTLQDILGLSDFLLEEIYTIAYSFYSQGKYMEAVGLFQLLTASKPACYKYTLGLSSCYHQLKMYDEAAFGFFLAFDAQPDNPIPPYYIADSLMKADMPEESNNFLDITMDICGDKPEFKILKERCYIMKSSLNKMLGKEEKPSNKKASSGAKSPAKGKTAKGKKSKKSS